MNLNVFHLGSHGGGSKFTLEFTRACISLNRQANLFISSGDDHIVEYDKLRIKIITFKTINRFKKLISLKISIFSQLLFFILISPFQIIKFYKALKRNDIFLCTMLHPFNLFFTWMFKYKNIRYYIVIHEPDTMRTPYPLIASYITRVEVSRAKGLIFLTASSKNKFESVYKIAKPNMVIPHGSFSYDLIYNEKDFKKNRIIKLFFFGRIEKYKGLSLLIDSYKLLKTIDSNYQLNIYGSGDFSNYQPLVDRFEDIHVDNRWIKEDEIPFIFSNNDICILPYLDASQSGVIPIASWFGVPVICTPVSGLKEQVVDGINGIVSKSINPSEIVSAILYLSKSENYKKISISAINLARKEWSWNDIVKQYLEFIFNKKT